MAGLYDYLSGLVGEFERAKSEPSLFDTPRREDVEPPQLPAYDYAPAKYTQETAPLYPSTPVTGRVTVQRAIQQKPSLIQNLQKFVSQKAAPVQKTIQRLTGLTPDMQNYLQFAQMFLGRQFPITQTPGPAAPSTRQYYSYHPGVDIATPVGTPIRLPFTGQVVYSGLQGGYGQRVGVVNPKTREVYYFSHLSRAPTLQGTVPAGTVIGYTGGARGTYGAGQTTGPHVDIERYLWRK